VQSAVGTGAEGWFPGFGGGVLGVEVVEVDGFEGVVGKRGVVVGRVDR
jgi:hypothetical protein